MIKIEHLFKSFGEIKAVNDISFSVNEGEMFSLLGVNGAGKSTTISIMCGLEKADSGLVKINGKDSSASKDILGIVFQNSALDMPLSVYDNLKNRAALYGIAGNEFNQRLEELSNLLEFKHLLKRTVSKLSGGERRKVDIARALLNKPKLLILDEPTTGLDPQNRKTIWEVIFKLQKEHGMTVLLTTHYMEEAADADRVIILDSGKICAQGTPIELKNKYCKDYINIYSVSEDKIKSLNLPYEKINGGFRLSLNNTQEAATLISNNSELFTDFEVIKGRMDDVFLVVTGKKLTGGEGK